MRLRVAVIALGMCVGTAVLAHAQNPPVPEGWVVLPVDEYRALKVTLLEPAGSEASFVVTGEARTREGVAGIPLVRLPAAERETGGVAVDIAGAGEVTAQQTRGLERADPSELGEPVASRESPSMIAFRHRPAAGADARSLTVEVVRYTPQAVVVRRLPRRTC